MEAARKCGVDLESHRSTLATEDMVRRADVILVFDDDNLAKLSRRFPGAPRSAHYLGVLAEDGPPVIASPYAGSLADFEACYRRIAQTRDATVSALGGRRGSGAA